MKRARLATAIATVGALFTVVTTLRGSGSAALSLPFAVYALLPYAALLAASRVVTDPWAIGGAGVAALAGEAGIRASVFIHPRGSTAAIALVFSPVFLTVVALPFGAAVGWLLGRAWRWGRLLTRSAVVAVSALSTVSIVVGFGWPELMPGPVLRRQAALDRIGAPRVVTGASAFVSMPVSPTQEWFQTGRLDDEPGDAIAVIGGNGAVLLDPVDFHERGRVRFRLESLRWAGDSMLVRLDRRMVAVRTSGVAADTEVQTLDGALLWRFRPSPQLSAVSLWPADLDGDGRIEFYADNGDFIARLDADGKEAWRRPALYPAGLLLSGPRTSTSPAWVVAVQSDRVSIWDERGSPLGAFSISAPRLKGIADWPERRTLLDGDTTLRGLVLDGTQAFEIPLGDFHFSQAVAVRFTPDGPRHLAIAAAGPRDVPHWRFLVLAPDRSIVYDEILDHWALPLVARRRDGADTLLVSGNGLRALRPR